MKRRMSIILVLVVCFSLLFSFDTFAGDNINVYVDNVFTKLMDANGNTVYPFIQKGTTYIPVRGISQSLDCIVKWDGDNQNVMIYKDIAPDNKIFRNNSGEVKLYVDNEEQKLYDANGAEVKPFIKNGTTYVPLRGVSKVLGYPVEWEGQTKSVYVWKDDVSPNGVTMDFLRPYEMDSMREYYESEGEFWEIDGEYYTNALENYSGSWFTASALFHLDGKYDALSCVISPNADKYDEKTVTFIVDGKVIETIIVEPNSPSQKISIDLEKGLLLNIMIDGYAGLGDITFYGE